MKACGISSDVVSFVLFSGGDSWSDRHLRNGLRHCGVRILFFSSWAREQTIQMRGWAKECGLTSTLLYYWPSYVEFQLAC